MVSFTVVLKPLAAVLLAILASTQAFAACPDSWLEFDTTTMDTRINFSAANHSDVPLTFTMKFNLRGLDPSRETTFTESLQPGETRPVMTLERSIADVRGNYRYDYRCTVGDKDADHDDDFVYVMPYEEGTSYRVLQGYGARFSHTGRERYTVDFKMQEGTPVHAARAGLVAKIEEQHTIGCWENGCGKYANYIVIVHDDDTTGEYYHLQKDGVLVEPGTRVETGQLIALSGNTGHTTMPHLHFGVYRATDWGREQSIPVRFITQDGLLDQPRSGGRYFATSEQRVSLRNDEETRQPERLH